MDLNFSLILVVLIFVTGCVWLLDIMWLAAHRMNMNSSAIVEIAEPIYVEYSKSFFPVLLIVFVLRSFIVEPFQIPSPSMVPTLQVGDFILVNKFIYGLRLPIIRTKVININQPKRGDVMVFFPPHENRHFIKRVVGLPGDTIEYNNNQLFINGKKIPEQLKATLPIIRSFYQIYEETLGGVQHETKKLLINKRYQRDNQTHKVPPRHYFMMGDNRNNSSDSRSWGAVPEENIVGKAFAIWMHWEKFLSFPSFSRVGSID